MFAEFAFPIFEQSIIDYHVIDDVYQPVLNPYEKGSVEHLLYAKNWVDTVQWHYEDIVRDPNIDPVAALDLKRKIDALVFQFRTGTLFSSTKFRAASDDNNGSVSCKKFTNSFLRGWI
jgi:hypothetical protein